MEDPEEVYEDGLPGTGFNLVHVVRSQEAVVVKSERLREARREYGERALPHRSVFAVRHGERTYL